MNDNTMIELAGRAGSAADIGRLLCDLRRYRARRFGERVLSYRSIAHDLEWPHTTVGSYLSGKVLPPTDRLDVLVGYLGAAPDVRRAFADARDRVEDLRRGARAS